MIQYIHTYLAQDLLSIFYMVVAAASFFMLMFLIIEWPRK